MKDKENNSVLCNSKKKCTGCGGCLAACPFDAIIIDYDKDGFIVPIIDSDKCVNCGRCKSVCYRFDDNSNNNKLESEQVMAVYSLSEDIKKISSSGGLGYEIAAYAIGKGFEVWGVAYDYQKNKAVHKKIDRIELLDDICGSKYIQSDTAEMMTSIRDGRVGKKAVFFGTPCQIYSIRKYIKDNEWILVDVFCSGVPTYYLWEKYLSYLKYNYEIKNPKSIKFRDKKYSWHECQISVEDKAGKVYSSPASEDMFYHFFLSKLCFRDSCFDCSFKLQDSYSDIRIGDFWGNRFKNIDTGVSLALIGSNTGRQIITELIQENRIASESASFTEVLEAQNAINKSRSRKVDKIRRLIKVKDIEYVYSHSIAPSKLMSLIKNIYHALPNPIYMRIRKLRGYD